MNIEQTLACGRKKLTVVMFHMGGIADLCIQHFPELLSLVT